MGCEGGSIPRRSEMVKTKKKDVVLENALKLAVLWLSCAISREPLRSPVVSDGLGRLFNRESVLELLVSGRPAEGPFANIKSLKDVTTLTLSPNPAAAAAQKHSALVSVSKVANVVPPFICPITSKEMSGTSRFVYPPCGCVISEEALREVKAETCLVCGKAFNAEDVIPVNSADTEEIEKLRSRMEARQALREAIDAQKKASKAKKKRKSGAGTEVDLRATEDADLSTKKKTRVDTHSSNINMALPNLSDPTLLPPGMRVQSEAVKSLFVKKDKDGKVIEQKNNFLVRGTFNRFAASF